MAEPLRTVETQDGRRLAFAVWGDPDGFPLLMLHGTPGCRLQRWPVEEVYVEQGVCWVTYDRSGYGRSASSGLPRTAPEGWSTTTGWPGWTRRT